jgi:hypothetical protein
LSSTGQRLQLGFRVIAFFALVQFLFVYSLTAQELTHGPVFGGVTEAHANVFVRTSKAAAVALKYSTDPGLQNPQTTGQFFTDDEHDFTAIVPLAGLTPETTYYVDVLVNGASQFSQPYPMFTTFPVPGTSRAFNFVVIADFREVAKLREEVQTYASASAERPAFAFIGGDFDMRNPQTLEDRREMFKELFSPATPLMSGFAPLILRRMPIVHQWDDHDSGLNNVDKNYADWDLAQQAFEEYVPSYPLPSITPGIWQTFQYAQAECFVLDCRTQRDPGTDLDGPDKSMLDGNNLGPTGELAWLENGLGASTAKWKIVFTSVITNPSTKENDAWGAYQTEWNALKNFILTNKITNVVFISGDLHLGAIDDGTAAGFPEMCVSGANQIGNGGCATARTGTWSEGYYDGDCAGFGLVSVLQNPDRIVLQAADQFGVVHVSYTVNDMASGAPIIVKQPANVTVESGKSARFQVVASGDRPLTAQWRKNGVDIDGATKARYVTPPTTPADDNALFSVVVSDASGSITSNSAKLTVISNTSRP